MDDDPQDMLFAAQLIEGHAVRRGIVDIDGFQVGISDACARFGLRVFLAGQVHFVQVKIHSRQNPLIRITVFYVEYRAQDLIARDQNFQAFLQQVFIQPALQAQRKRRMR